MRLLPFLAIVALVPLAGCFHGVIAAGVPKEALDAKGYQEKDRQSQEQAAGLAKIEVRSYEKVGLVGATYAYLTVVTVSDVPLLTSRAVAAAASEAEAKVNAKENGTVEIDFGKAGAGKIAAKRFEVTQDGVTGHGFRAEFECPDGYVLVSGFGATAPIPGAADAFESVKAIAAEVTCTSG